MSVDVFRNKVESTSPLDAGTREELKSIFQTLSPNDKYEAILLLNEVIANGRNGLTDLREELAPENSVDMGPLITSSPTPRTVTPAISKSTMAPVSPEGVITATTHIATKLPEGVSQTDAFKLMQKIILAGESIEKLNDNVVSQKIKKYQEEHNLSVDGKIGSHTYAELLTESYYTDEKYREFSENGINKTEQDKILDLLSYANWGSQNVAMLILKVKSYESVFKTKNSTDFEKDYGDFYKTFSEKVEEKKSSPEGQKLAKDIQSATGSDGKSLFRKIMDGDWEEILSDPKLFIFAGLGFLFGMFGTNSKLTDTWWKRVLVIGTALYNKDSIHDIIGDLKGFWNSPERRAKYDQGKTWAQETASSIYAGVTGIDLSEVGEKFDGTWNSITSLHEGLVQDGKGHVSEENLPKFTKLTGLKAFWNLSKSDLSSINSYTDLAAKIPEEEIAKLELSASDDTDIKNFIHNYFLPQMGENDVYVRDMFVIKKVVDAVSETLSSFNGNLNIKNESQKGTILKNFANIFNSPNSSELAKRAAKELLQATQSGDVSRFKLTDYTMLEDSEKTALQLIIDQVTHIFEVQKQIQTQTEAINARRIITSGNFPDDDGTLKQKYDLFVKAETELQEYIDGLDDETHGIKKSDFSISDFETAFQTKKQEIFDYAGKPKSEGGLGLNAFAGVDIVKEREALKKQQEVTKLTTEAEKLISQIENVPTVDASPIEMRKWYDEYKDDFGELEKIKGESSLIGNPVIAKIDTALGKMKEFEDNYTAVYDNFQTRRTDLITKLEGVTFTDPVSINEFIEIRQQIDKITDENIALMNEVDIPWWEGFSFGDLFDTKKNYSYEAGQDNALVYLHRELGITPDVNTDDFNAYNIIVTQKVLELEKALNTDIDMSGLDITDINTVTPIVRAFNEHKEFLSKTGIFSQPEVIARKKDELLIDFTALKDAYIVAIQGADQQALDTLRSDYRTAVTGGASGITSFLGFESDPVKEAIVKRQEELDKEAIYTTDFSEAHTKNPDFFKKYDEFTLLYDPVSPGISKNPAVQNIVHTHAVALMQSNSTETVGDFITYITSYTTYLSTDPNFADFRKDAQDVLDHFNTQLIK